jgi:nucleotide-binding universal stress UspA family protein
MRHFKKILLPVDLPPLTAGAIAQADELAVENGGRLAIVHVVDDGFARQAASTSDAGNAESLLEARLAQAKEALQDLARGLKTPGDRIDLEIIAGSPVSAICERSKDADLVVMPTHGRQGTTYLMMGSVAERVIRGAHCAVLVVRP